MTNPDATGPSLREAAIAVDDALNRWMERHWTMEYPFQSAEKALHEALYGHKRGSAISPCAGDHALAKPAASAVIVPCPRCGGEGYDNVFLDGDTPRHCGADVSFREQS